MMEIRTVKVLTFFLFLLNSFDLFAGVIEQKKLKTHLRWNIFVSKDDVSIRKNGTSVILSIFKPDLLEKIKNEIDQIRIDLTYFSQIKFNGAGDVRNPSSLEVKLTNENVDLFSFYRNHEKKYVMDFWIDSDSINLKKAAISREIPEKKSKSKSKSVKISFTPKPLKKKVVSIPPPSPKKIILKNKNVGYRDFRYGASFIWDYEPLIPKLKRTINLSSKTPEYFYPIKDREYEKSDKEAHLQLSVNLYRKKKWGLMYKSIKLFAEKYGDEECSDMNEYLKANAIIRNNIIKKDKAPLKMAINVLEDITLRTYNYDLKRGIFKYLIEYYLDSKEHIKALQKSKKLYVASMKNFDIEESQVAATTIIYCLARLNQVEAVNEFMEEKIVKKLIPRQVQLAYQFYVKLKVGDVEDVIRIYEENKKSLVKPVDQTILYNVAEAYFRKADLKKSVELFDQFVSKYSYNTCASNARLRIALAYEIQEFDIAETVELYRNAINRSQSPEIGYEAKIRYVALRTVRKIRPDSRDIEVRVFLEKDESEKKISNKNLTKLLWLVRLRTFVADKQWDKAISYLNVIPVNSMRPSDRRVFESDGAEVIYGILVENYKKSNYSRILQQWEVYRKKYVEKVALDGTMNFIACHSYIKLGLYDGFDKAYVSFKRISSKGGPARTYPIWTNKRRQIDIADMLLELRVIRNIKLKNWKLAAQVLSRWKSKSNRINKINYYMGIIAYYQKNYKNVVKYLETYLARQNEKSIYDAAEIAELIRIYTDSIYKQKLIDRFKIVANAILKDTKNYAPDNQYMLKVRERISYLLIEILAEEKKKGSFLLLEKKIVKFQKDYKESVYSDKVRFLLGVSLIANKKDDQGKDVLGKIIEDDKVSPHIREMSKTELSLVRIREKTI